MNNDDLRKLAEAATPGPWSERGNGHYGYVTAPADGYITRDVIRMDGSTMAAFAQEANRKFIATANPAKIIELLDTIEQQRKLLGMAGQMLSDLNSAYGAENVDALVQTITNHLRQQEGETK